MNKKITIISGANEIRYKADKNHKKYADSKGVDYHFYLKTDLVNPFFTKCFAICDCFKKDYEYILWVDDDVFFIDPNWDFIKVFEEHTEDVIVTRGRPKKTGITLFNNGVMFIRNTPEMRGMFERIPLVSLSEMKNKWKPEWGPMVGNDQPRMIYLTQTLYHDKIKIIDYPGFNAHEVSFKNKRFIETKPPLVHITGTKKQEKMNRFMQNTGISLFSENEPTENTKARIVKK